MNIGVGSGRESQDLKDSFRLSRRTLQNTIEAVTAIATTNNRRTMVVYWCGEGDYKYGVLRVISDALSLPIRQRSLTQRYTRSKSETASLASVCQLKILNMI